MRTYLVQLKHRKTDKKVEVIVKASTSVQAARKAKYEMNMPSDWQFIGWTVE